MKKKISLLIIVFGIISSGLLMANTIKGGGGNFFERMVEVLELTETQKTQIAPIVEKYQAEAEVLHEKEYADRYEKRAAMHSLMEKAKAEIEPFLTEEQKTKAAEMRGRRGHGHRGHHGHGFKGNEELKEEMKAYAQKEILPIAREERRKLDAVISAEDQQKIAEMRTKFKAHKEAHKAKKMEMMESGELKGKGSCEGKPRGDRACGMDETTKAEHKALKEEGKALLDKYEADIKPLFEGMIQTNGEKWKADMKAIVEKHEPEMAERFDKHDGKEGRHGKGFHKPFGKLLHPIKFLMLDPDGNDFEDSAETMPNKGVDRQFEVFPNPASDKTTVKYEVLESGNVSIGVYSRTGKLVKSAFDQYQQAGKYSVEVDLSNLDDKMYIIRINDASGQLSESLMMK